MRSASRQSLAISRERIGEIVGAGVAGNDPEAGAAQWQDLAAQLRAVAGLLVTEPGLRRALADPTRAPRRRARLLSEVLGSRAGDTALRVLDSAVQQRWSGGVDLLNAVELLAVDAELETAAQHDALSDVEDELFRFSHIVSAHPELARALGDTGRPLPARVELAQGLLRDKAQPVTIRLVTTALSGLGGRNFAAGLVRLVELTARRREAQVAYVRSAAPLTSGQEDRLVRHLQAVYGQQISLHVRIDPAVVGGAIVEIGDDRYDGSIARLLAQARAELTA